MNWMCKYFFQQFRLMFSEAEAIVFFEHQKCFRLISANDLLVVN